MSPIWGVLNLLLVTYCNGEDPMKQKSLYAYCDQYLPHCYYSDGNPIDVMSTTEADNFCKSINEKGRLLDFALGGEINKVKMFLANYSLNKVLLNAKIENGRWKWIQQGNDIAKNSKLTTQGEQLFYMLQSDNSENFHVVCMTECKPNWILKKKVSGNSRNTLKFNATNVKSCQDLCDVNKTCVGVDWTPEGIEKCGLLMKKNYNYVVNPLVKHYVIDRSSRNVENCVGPIYPKTYVTTQNSIQHVPKAINVSPNHAVQPDNNRNNQNSQIGIHRIFSGNIPLHMQKLKDNGSAEFSKVHIRRLTTPPILSLLKRVPLPNYDDDMDPFPDNEYEAVPDDSGYDATSSEYYENTDDTDDIDEAPQLPTKKKAKDPKGKKKYTNNGAFPTWFVPSEPTGTMARNARKRSEMLPNKKNPMSNYWCFSVLGLGIAIGCSLSAGEQNGVSNSDFEIVTSPFKMST